MNTAVEPLLFRGLDMAVRPIGRKDAAPCTTEFIDPLQDAAWDEMAAAHPGCSIFHSSAWARVLARAYGHHAQYLRIHRDGGTQLLLPMMEVRSPVTGRRGVSIPFADSCEALAFTAAGAHSLDEALAAIARENRWKHVELRGGFPRWPATNPVREGAFYSHVVDLHGGRDAIFARCTSAARRAVRKAERGGVSARVGQRLDDMEVFFRLHCATRQRLGVPPQPWNFFRIIHEEVIERGFGFVVLASNETGNVAGGVYFQFGPAGVYKFGASDPAGREVRGNNLVMWAAIKELTDRGAVSLSLGRTSAGNLGLRRYKLSWGADEAPLNYYRLDPITGRVTAVRDRASGAFIKLFQLLPGALNRLLGAAIYPHLD